VQQLSDAELAQRAQDGALDAIGELYDRHHTRIFRYVRSRITHDQVAQDLTGEVFLRMVTRIGSYRDMGVPLSAWLYRIARNCLLDYLAREDVERRSELEQFADTEVSQANPATIVEARHEAQHVHAALQALEEMEREVVILRFLAGFSLLEVASSVDRSVPAVKAIQYRGLKRLRKLVSRG